MSSKRLAQAEGDGSIPAAGAASVDGDIDGYPAPRADPDGNENQKSAAPFRDRAFFGGREAGAYFAFLLSPGR